MLAMVRGDVLYACYLDEKASAIVRNYQANHPDMSLEECVMGCHNHGEIDLYGDSYESDYVTVGVETVDEDH